MSQEEFDAFRDETREALADRSTMVSKIATDPDGFEEHVATTLAEVRRDEAYEKARTRHEARLDRLDQTVTGMERWLELTPQQSDQMRSVLLARYEREAELARRHAAGEDPAVLGEVKQSNHETHQTELSGFLTPEQVQLYTRRQHSGRD